MGLRHYPHRTDSIALYRTALDSDIKRRNDGGVRSLGRGHKREVDGRWRRPELQRSLMAADKRGRGLRSEPEGQGELTTGHSLDVRVLQLLAGVLQRGGWRSELYGRGRNRLERRQRRSRPLIS